MKNTFMQIKKYLNRSINPIKEKKHCCFLCGIIAFILILGISGFIYFGNISAAGIEINSENIENYDCDIDATSCYLGDKGISKIANDTFMYHNNLTELNLENNHLTSIDLSNLHGLTSLKLGNNNIISADLSGLTGLQLLNLENNQLTSINLSGLGTLNILNLSNNQLTSIDLSEFILYKLDISNNQLTLLDLTNVSEIGGQHIGESGIREIYLQNNLLTNIIGLRNLHGIGLGDISQNYFPSDYIKQNQKFFEEHDISYHSQEILPIFLEEARHGAAQDDMITDNTYYKNGIPIAKNVQIGGDANLGTTLSGSYDYVNNSLAFWNELWKNFDGDIIHFSVENNIPYLVVRNEFSMGRIRDVDMAQEMQPQNMLQGVKIDRAGDDAMISGPTNSIFKFVDNNWIQLGDDFEGNIVHFSVENNIPYLVVGHGLDENLSASPIRDFDMAKNKDPQNMLQGVRINNNLNGAMPTPTASVFKFVNNNWTQLGDELDGFITHFSIENNIPYLAIGDNPNQSSKNLQKGEKTLHLINTNPVQKKGEGIEALAKSANEIDGLNQSLNNAQDAVSLIQIADSALNNIYENLQEIRELVLQITNTGNTLEESFIQEETNRLTSEINEIGNTTEVNSTKLLDGSFDTSFQVGNSFDDSISLAINDMRAAALGISSTVGGNGFTNDQTVTNNTESEYALDVSVSTSIAVIEEAMDNISSERSKLDATKNTLDDIINSINTTIDDLLSGPATSVFKFVDNSWIQLGDDFEGTIVHFSIEDNVPYLVVRNDADMGRLGDGDMNEDGDSNMLQGLRINKGDDDLLSGPATSIFKFVNNNWIQLGDDFEGNIVHFTIENNIPYLVVEDNPDINRLGDGDMNEDGDSNMLQGLRIDQDDNLISGPATSIFKFVDNSWIQLGDDFEGNIVHFSVENNIPYLVVGDDLDIANENPQNMLQGLRINKGDDDLLSGPTTSVFKFVNDNWVQLGDDLIGNIIHFTVENDIPYLVIGDDFSKQNMLQQVGTNILTKAKTIGQKVLQVLRINDNQENIEEKLSSGLRINRALDFNNSVFKFTDNSWTKLGRGFDGYIIHFTVKNNIPYIVVRDNFNQLAQSTLQLGQANSLDDGSRMLENPSERPGERLSSGLRINRARGFNNSVFMFTALEQKEGGSTYQRLKNDTIISGATNKSYTITSEDLGQTMFFEVTPKSIEIVGPKSEELSLYGLNGINNEGGEEEILDKDTSSQGFEFVGSKAKSEGFLIPTAVTPTTPPANPNNGGGGGGITLIKDNCPGGDCSQSYYDDTCDENCNETHNSAEEKLGDITDSPYSHELNNAYQRAYSYGITTMPTIQKADLEGTLIRKDMAKIITEFATNILGKNISTGTICEFDDIEGISKEMQSYAIASCKLGLMGLENDGLTPKKNFDPNQEVNRAQFGTILSRLLRTNKYDNGIPYYKNHLQALKTEGIMSKIENPLEQELRGWVMLMMERISEKE